MFLLARFIPGPSGGDGPPPCHASPYVEGPKTKIGEHMDLTAIDEAELLARMALQAHAREDARAAWAELYERHRRYVFVVASRSYGSFLGEDGTVDLVVDTFRRAYEWAGRQMLPDQVRAQFASENRDSTRRRVLAWLGAIAQRLFKDKYRDDAGEAAEFDAYLDDWRRVQAQPRDDNSPLGLEHLQTALASLSAAEADALRVSLPWYDLDTRSFAVPKGEATRLAALLGITPEALRQRRHRAIYRIEQHLGNAGYIAAGQEEPA